jgi:hypothetical protein
VRYPVSKTGGLRPWGFDSLSFRLRSGVVERVRRATVDREAQVRSLPSEPVARPRGRTGYDAGLSIRKLRVRVPPGVLTDRSPARLRRAMMTSIGIDFI